MPAHREMLEGEAYWGRIRGIKRRLFVLELILIAVLGCVLILFSSEFQTNPFFIPVDSLLWFVIIMVLVIEIEDFVFRIMQIRIAKSDSTKHLMTINSMRRAVVIVIVAALIAVMFLTPAIVDGVDGSLTVRGEVRPDSPQQFLPGDPLGLSRVAMITVHCDVVAEVYVVSAYNYLRGVLYPGRPDEQRDRQPDDGIVFLGNAIIRHVHIFRAHHGDYLPGGKCDLDRLSFPAWQKIRRWIDLQIESATALESLQ
jgi:hypothetical protein